MGPPVDLKRAAPADHFQLPCHKQKRWSTLRLRDGTDRSFKKEAAQSGCLFRVHRRQELAPIDRRMTACSGQGHQRACQSHGPYSAGQISSDLVPPSPPRGEEHAIRATTSTIRLIVSALSMTGPHARESTAPECLRSTCAVGIRQRPAAIALPTRCPHKGFRGEQKSDLSY